MSSSEVKAEPNLVPILDMVFQLITFFMLVINFATAGIDQDLKLPVIGSAGTVDTKGMDDLLVLSIGLEDKDWAKKGKKEIYCLKFNTKRVSDVKQFMAEEARASRKNARPPMKEEEIATSANIRKCASEEERNKLKELPTRVVIRADRNAPYKVVDEVIVACQNNGFQKFALKAMAKEDTKQAASAGN